MMRNSHGKSFTYGIVQHLGQEIVTGAYGVQNPFPTEAELCIRLGVSRSILREAVKMLTTKGLLNARPRQGTWVEPEENWNLLDPDVLHWLLERKFSLSLLIEFTQVRLAIEPMAAALAAIQASPPLIEEIRLALEAMKNAERDGDAPLNSDIDFHVAILRASGNRLVSQFRDLIDVALRTSIRLTNQRKGVRFASIADHQRVADAIFVGDADAARDAMYALIDEALTLMKTINNGPLASGALAVAPLQREA
jgi:DNA-binding FadR family transcriptional regulator